MRYFAIPLVLAALAVTVIAYTRCTERHSFASCAWSKGWIMLAPADEGEG